MVGVSATPSGTSHVSGTSESTQMGGPHLVDDLLRYLQEGREGLLRALEGLDDYDVRRPLTPSGTNLLGLVKHVGYVQLGYFTVVFDRPAGRRIPGDEPDDEPDEDMWAAVDESRDDVLDLFRYSAERADETLAQLPLDAPGTVPWWRPESRRVTLHRIAVHVLAEINRHAGHADILREGLDGAAGMRPGDPNVPGRDAGEWRAYVARLEAAARAAGGLEPA